MPFSGSTYTPPTGALNAVPGTVLQSAVWDAIFTDISAALTLLASDTFSGTVNTGTAGQLTYYATSTNAVSGNANANISNGALTLGIATSVIGQLKLAGNTSGTATITPQAVAGTPTLTLPNFSGTFATLAGSEEFTNKTLTASVAKGVWTASGTWTLPAYTLGGTVSGGGNQINNVVIGTSTPLAGTFTTLTATGSGSSAFGSYSQSATIVSDPANFQLFAQGYTIPFNLINVPSDTVVASNSGLLGATDSVNALTINHSFGGASTKGSRNAFSANLTHASATGNSTESPYNAYYAAVLATAIGSGNDGGGLGTEIGSLYGLSAQVTLNNSATHWAVASGGEWDISVASGSSVANKLGLELSLGAVDAVAGTNIDTGLLFSNNSTASPGWGIGIVFGIPSGQGGYWPIKTTGTIIGTFSPAPNTGTGNGNTVATAAYGIDFSHVTFSTAFLKSTGFSVTGSGVTTCASLAITQAGNAAIEIGRVGSSSTPFIDFHSSASSTDFDARLIASGGTASDGAGTLTLTAAIFALSIATASTSTSTGSLTVAGGVGVAGAIYAGSFSTSGTITSGAINKVTITAPATGSTLTIADGKTLTASVTMTLQGGDSSVLSIAASKTLTCSNTLTFTGTDASSVACGAGGTVAYTNVTTLSSLVSVGTLTTGAINWAGAITTSGVLTITNATAASSTSTGCAIFSGGVGIAGAIYAGAFNSNGGLNITSGGIVTNYATPIWEHGSTSTPNTPLIDWHSSGNNIDYDYRMIASGGTGSAGNGTMTFTGAVLALNVATASTTTTTGCLTLAGGLGVAGATNSASVKVASGGALTLGNAATTGLTAGVLAALTNATIVISDSTGQAYRIPCII